MTRVCCFCETWGFGGIESFLINIFEQMDFNDLEIDIVAARLISDVNLQTLRRMGIGFYQLTGSTRKIFKNGLAFHRLQKERGYDVIHLNIFHGFSLRYAWLAKKEGIATRIAHSHGTGLYPSYNLPFKISIHHLSARLFCAYATAWWACSAKAANFVFRPSYAAMTRIVPDGIPSVRYAYNPGMRREMRRRLGMSDNFIVGQVGRLSKEKNQGFTLKVFSKLVRLCPEAKLLLVGEGEDREALEQKAVTLDIINAVVFCGFSDSVHELLQAMDILLLPSLFEGLGIVAIEAQAAGLPVLCSDEVPDETNISGRLGFLPLAAGEEIWAEHILAARGVERRDGSAVVAQAGYDSQKTAAWVRRSYLGNGE